MPLLIKRGEQAGQDLFAVNPTEWMEQIGMELPPYSEHGSFSTISKMSWFSPLSQWCCLEPEVGGGIGGWSVHTTKPSQPTLAGLLAPCTAGRRDWGKARIHLLHLTLSLTPPTLGTPDSHPASLCGHLPPGGV